MATAVALLLGAIIGILLGLLGGGGSILAVPALIYGVGLDIEQAIPISLIVVGASAAVGALPKIGAHLVEWRLAVIFAAAGLPAAFAGSAIGRLVPQPVLLIGFASVMILAAVRMLRDTEGVGMACKRTDSGINWRRCVSRSIPAGLGVGLLTGLFGVGGGFLIIPALVLMLGVQMPVAVGTSLVIIVANSASGLVAHLGAGGIDWALTGLFAGAAIIGSLIAGHVGTGMDTGRLQRWFAALVFVVAAFVVVDTVFLM
ncbi:sulfite exporter TauE/SafE family protein [Nocardia cyriacigeorgica]|uniref:Probable membrane transporter protein n=1 Tax=Nocardia cyriacigeorgica TaxID=135487 RepID=A0A6P1D649_9NOCA|nr:sulfite exporter TauE/SafE family protein [Nocardia cyriacigeorgica]NEW37596.1 sulfite exporter TauE/SafE family protein [Nocardia cyriacigeorgica]NEW45039.1 sulfite exporter TauE/SafE family protein [Nocardia cyriacigeorgica]NEW49016.1 sulfite exporter TauE/SafE family protein [Nocardia cyriacigeorgica]NEW55117.1 sulfite exporter TauE/SafE family protein [Nocardia cyriacigeorgica]